MSSLSCYQDNQDSLHLKKIFLKEQCCAFGAFLSKVDCYNKYLPTSRRDTGSKSKTWQTIIFYEISLKILRSRIWNTVFFFSIWLLLVLQIMCLVGACYEWVQIAWHCTNMLFCCKTVNNLNEVFFLHTMPLSEQIID